MDILKARGLGSVLSKIGSATTLTPSTVAQPIPKGYYGGALVDGKVAAVANASPSNIRNGVTIAGVTGALLPDPAHNSQSYTTAGTYTFTVPADVRQITVLVQGGGGGGGGGCAYGTGGSGGAGGVQLFPLAVTPGNNYSVVVGSGGSIGVKGTASVSGTAGGNGGNSSFDSYVAGGGIGGGGGIKTGGGGAGGTGGTGGNFGGAGNNGNGGIYIGTPWATVANTPGVTSIGGFGNSGYGGGSNTSGYANDGQAGTSGRVVVFW